MKIKLGRYLFILSVLILILIFIPITSQVSADEIENIEKQELESEDAATPDIIIPEEIEGDYVKVMPTYYSSSSENYDNVKDLTKAILKKNKAFEKNFSFVTSVDPKTLMNAYENALYQAGNDYVLGTLSEYGYSVKYSTVDKKTTYFYKMSFEYIATIEQENYVTKKVKAIAKSLTKSGMTELEKVVAVNDYVVTHAAYSTATKNSPHHIYTYLTEGKAVCQAYALLTYRLLKEMGIESRYVVGYAQEAHGWNAVKVDGVWYYLDTTWNDSTINNVDTLSNVSYSYFLVTSATLSKDHYWNKALYPVATDKRYSYFNQIYRGILHKGDIYYNSNKDFYLYKLNIKTGKSKLLVNHRANYLEAHNEFIYFSDYSNGGYLTSYNLLTGKTAVLDKALVSNLQVVNGYLQYISKGKVKTYLLPKVKKLAAFNAKNVTITNNIGNDKVAFKNLTKGYKYTVYADPELKKKLFSFTASKTTYNKSLKQIGAKAGAVYVVVSKKFYKASTATKVSYKAQPTAAIASKNVKITNSKAKDTINFTGLKKGTTYTIYKDEKKKTELTSFKATTSTKTLTVKQLGKTAGALYITAKASGYRVSAITVVNYSKEK